MVANHLPASVEQKSVSVMRRSIYSPRARRRGQALLLAVLIMIFAALLSAAFIGVVAVNLSQTARQSDKNIALASARAGLKQVNRQLTYGAKGDRWDPKSLIPAANTLDYQFYYSEFDEAQGWAGSFAKFPDPRAGANGGPHYMAKIERVPLTLLPTHPEFDYIGALKITVIGFSPEDPTAYERIIAYKGGVQRAPVGRAIRVVSNFDFNTKRTLIARFAGTANTGVTGPDFKLDVSDATGDFSKLARPFAITLSKPNATNVTESTARTAVVTNVSGTGPNFTFDLAEPLTATPTLTEDTRIELAANLGGSLGIDSDNRPVTLTPEPFATRLSFTDQSSNYPFQNNQVDGVRVNGGLVWSGNIDSFDLRAPSAAFGTTTVTGIPGDPVLVPGIIQASGTIAPDQTANPIALNIRDVVPPAVPTPYDVLKASDSTGVFAAGAVKNANREELVNDGWNRIKGVATATTTTRSVPDFQPPVIDSGEALDRYRNLARYSNPVGNFSGSIGAVNGGALYGYGQGIYIDNTLDKEMIYDTTLSVPRRREMNQTELTRMWLSNLATGDTTVNDYLRISDPIPNTDPNFANASLEQKHIRGWVGHDEFRARGVEIELSDNRVIITRDARTDAVPDGSSDAQVWKAPGAGTPVPGRFTEVLPWPANGVIFAEGNVRIKGNATRVNNSLTVVSMGNIYIEDSLSADNDANAATPTSRRILLLAKKNVVMNPTRVMARPDAFTRADGNQNLAAGPGQVLKVIEGLSFKVGDLVQQVTGTTVTFRGYVTAIADDSLTVDVSIGGTVNGGQLITTPTATDTRVASTTWAGKSFASSQITSGDDVIQRRVTAPAVTTNTRIAFNHRATRVNAVRVATETPTGNANYTGDIHFTNNAALISPDPGAVPYIDHAKSVTGQADNKFHFWFTGPDAGGPEEFPGPVPAIPATKADADLITLSSLTGDMNGIEHNDGNPDPLARVSWKYNTSFSTGYGNLPFYYLASVGNRQDFPGTGFVADLRKSINPHSTPAGVAYDIPLATSINFRLNGAPAAVSNESWNASLSTYDSTAQFGFNPQFVNVNPAIPANDILTGDQSFYQPDSVQSTLDSRQPALNAGVNGFVLQPFSGLPTLTAPAAYPSYLLLGSKLEDVALNNSVVTNIGPAYKFDVRAYVYAQNGSWFVIPTPTFDERLRGDLTQTFLDLDGDDTADPGEYLDVNNSGGFDAGDYADLNRNGSPDSFEQVAMLRYSRYNYEINFNGAIAENQTVLVNDFGTKAKGAVATWMDRLATVTYDRAASPTTAAYDRIKYVFDPSLAQGSLDNEDGFLLPQTDELYNIT